MTNHGASQAPPPAVSVTESRKSFGGTTVLDGIARPSPRAASIIGAAVRGAGQPG
jgi:hypothetical protein